MKVNEFFLKLILGMVVLLCFLSFADIMALTFSIRPLSVLVYVSTGVFAYYTGNKIHEKVIQRREDPLPEYILRKTRETAEEVEVMKELMEDRGISKEEVQMRAKVREEGGRNLERKDKTDEEQVKEKSI